MIMVMNNIVAATVFHFKQSRYCKTKRHQMIADQIFLANIWRERDFCSYNKLVTCTPSGSWLTARRSGLVMILYASLSLTIISHSHSDLYLYFVRLVILLGDGAKIRAKHERSFHQAPESEHALVLCVCHTTLVGTKIKDIMIKSFHQNERLLCQQKAHQGNSTQVLAPELQIVCNAPDGHIA